MNAQVNTVAVETTTTKARAAYLVQRDGRTRMSFGHVWLNSVLGGVVTDQEKLVAHAIKLKVGTRGDLLKLRPETLLTKVQDAIMSA